MRKSIFLFAILAVLTAGTVSAQKHWTSAELNLLGAGVRYEYVINRYISVGANLHYNYYGISYIWLLGLDKNSILGLNAVGRWYPFGRRFFTELGLGGYSYTYGSKYEERTGFGFAIVPGFGWVIDVGQPAGFFVSPGVKVPWIFSTDVYGPALDFYLGIGIAR